MPFYRFGKAGFVHLKLSGKGARNPPKPCVGRIEIDGTPARCCAMSGFACDWPVTGGTCDAPLCEEHAVTVGKNRHYCPIHAAQHREHLRDLFDV